MDTWCDVPKCLKVWIRLKKRDIFAEHIPFLAKKPWERKREKEEKSKTSFDDPWSSVSRNSSGKELKFIYSMRAPRVYQKRGISLKIQRRISGEIKVSRFRRCSRDLLPFYYAPRGKGSSYFGLFPTSGLF